MRLLKDKRGQIRVIEAFFASVLLLSSLSLLPMMQENSGSASDVLSSTAQNVLFSLDSNGHLAELVDSRNWTALQTSLQSTLPLTIWFNLTVFDENMAQLNDFPISNGGAVSEKIEATDYVCASTNATYSVYVLRLQLAAVD
jgi:hypothetical protein